jgi:hypothetical protein
LFVFILLGFLSHAPLAVESPERTSNELNSSPTAGFPGGFFLLETP